MSRIVERGNVVRVSDPRHARGIHTVYSGNRDSGTTDAGHAKQHTSTVFLGGRARVDSGTKQRLKDTGAIK